MELFERVLELPAADRSAYLDAHCADDAVRQKVTAMLMADSQVSGLLEQDADQRLAVLNPELNPDTRTPERIGPYRIVERIGQGGMATVYRAERDDQDFRQVVALKLILPSRSARHWETRFRRERQILASLQHPNIAALLDGGVTENAEPYFAMEFVDGLPITAYCDDNRLSIEARVRLLLAVCDAVNYAHGNLIVHRDLKPSNILVDANGLPKLLDFGIAKLLSDEATDRTQTSLRALTPDYAAPEQFAGGTVTTAVDIYALGGLLYELLCGRRPFGDVRGSALDIERQIRDHGAPTFASILAALDPEVRLQTAAARRLAKGRLQRSISGDLENIALKALRAEPGRRYATVDALSADLQRYLDGMPVLARADTSWYRLKKFVQRHPVGVPLGAIAVVALVASTGIALQQSDQARTAAAKARLEAARANETRDFVTSLFEFANPDMNLGERLTARQLLDLGANRVDEELAGQPGLRAEMLLLLAKTYGQLGLYDEALPLARQAGDLYQALPDAMSQADAVVVQARLTRQSGDYDTAITLLDQASDLLPDDDRARRATLLVERGEVLRERAEFDAAETAFEDALQLDRSRLAPPSDIARDLYRLGTLKFSAGDSELALELLQEAADLLAAAGATVSTQFASIQHDIGVMLIQRGDLVAAEAVLVKARETREQLLGDAHPDLAVTLKELAGIARQQGRGDIAEALYLDALAINETMLGADHPETANNLNSLAVFYRGQGENARALEYAQRALAGAREAYGERHPTVGLMTVNVGSMQRVAGNLGSAYESVSDGLSILTAALGEDHHLAGVAYNALASVQQAQNHDDDAEANYRKALSIFDATAVDSHPHTVAILNGLASLLIRGGRIDEAAENYRRAVAIGQAVLPPEHPNLAIVALGLGHVAAKQGQCPTARAAQLQNLPIIERAGHGQRDDVALAVRAIDACL